MAVRMRKVLARPWVGVRVSHLLLLLFIYIKPRMIHITHRVLPAVKQYASLTDKDMMNLTRDR